MRRILVTSALPYANGAIHLGHLLEHIQTDIWVRFQRLVGNQCIYVCADDAHGTATMLAAEAAGQAPETLIEARRAEHAEDLRGFHIAHDNYHSTHAPENARYLREIYARLKEGGRIFSADVAQLYDAERNLFLADRYLRGTCPRCGAADQHGDNCEECSATYDATELVEPRSLLSGATPELRQSSHYFVDLPQFQSFLEEWIATDAVQPEVANKLREWLDGGLRAWDISRDAPYFGFPIPDAEGKYFYVWMDAPIGYMASFRNLCDRTEGLNFDDFWRAGGASDTEVHHFIGKDIVNFHCLFWPAVLHGAGFRTPTRVHVHGMLTVDGMKMSKSRGTFINARTYLDHLDPECLRYYFATKLAADTGDMDLQFDDFAQRVNTDLVGKVVNIAARCASFINRHFDGRLADDIHDLPLWNEAATAGDELAALYERGDFDRVVRRITALADLANRHIAAHEPWKRIKQDGRAGEVQSVCSLGINVFRALVVYLKPIAPVMAARAERFLNVAPLAWADARAPLLGHRIEAFEPLFERIDKKAVQRMIEATRAEAAAVAQPPSAVAGMPAGKAEADGEAGRAAPAADDPPATITLDDFLKIDLRVARVVRARTVDGADKLLELELDLGTEQRRVFSGIRASYDPSALVDRLVAVVANLAPRTMRFGTSEGMILAAGDGAGVFLLSADAGAAPGTRIT